MRRCIPVLCLILALLGSASAHPQFALSTVNRYGRLVLLPGRALLDYSLMVGEVPAERVKREADLDGNGVLSAAEQQQLSATLLAAVEREVSVRLDGNRVPLRLVLQPLVLKSPKVEAAPFALELTAEIATGEPTDSHTLVFDDRADIPPVGEVELRVEEGPGIALLATQSGSTEPTPKATAQGPEQPKLSTLFRQFGPPRSLLSDRSVTLRFRPQQPLPSPSVRTWSGGFLTSWKHGLGIAALLVLCVLGLFARRLLRT